MPFTNYTLRFSWKGVTHIAPMSNCSFWRRIKVTDFSLERCWLSATETQTWNKWKWVCATFCCRFPLTWPGDSTGNKSSREWHRKGVSQTGLARLAHQGFEGVCHALQKTIYHKWQMLERAFRCGAVLGQFSNAVASVFVPLCLCPFLSFIPSGTEYNKHIKGSVLIVLPSRLCYFGKLRTNNDSAHNSIYFCGHFSPE